MKRITSASSEVSDEPVHKHSLARSITERIHKIRLNDESSDQNVDL